MIRYCVVIQTIKCIHHILQYDGRIKERHGRYMNQLSPTDPRYTMLHTIPRIQQHYMPYTCWVVLNHGLEMYFLKTTTPRLNITNTNIVCSIHESEQCNSYQCTTTDGINYVWKKYKKYIPLFPWIAMSEYVIIGNVIGMISLSMWWLEDPRNTITMKFVLAILLGDVVFLGIVRCVCYITRYLI